MSLKKSLLATAITLVSGTSLAGGLDYSYIQGGYIDYDGADGLNLELSIEFDKHWYGRIEHSDLDSNNSSADGNLTRLNAGFKAPVSDTTDFIAELGFEDVDVDTGFGVNFNDDGYNALVGLRSMASSNLELGGFVQYSDVLESTDITAEARYHFSNNFSVAAEIGHDSEADEHFGINFRYSF